MTELTKEQKIDAAVAAVQMRAREAVAAHADGTSYLRSEYTEASDVATLLQDQGVLVWDEHDEYQAKDRARKRLEGQAKRLLDAEAAKPDARVLRFSSRTDGLLPRLNGVSRGQYGNTVGYITPELYERALMAVQARLDQERSEQQEMDALLEQAHALGLPQPVKSDRRTVTYDAAGLRKLLELGR